MWDSTPPTTPETPSYDSPQSETQVNLNALFYAFAFLVMIACIGFALTKLPYFYIKHMTIQPSQLRHVSSEQIKTMVEAEAKGHTFFDIKINRLRENIEHLPWVKSVSIRRRWPDRLQLTIREQQEVARWGQDSLLSADGELFKIKTNLPLPVLEGPVGSEKLVLEKYGVLQKIMGKHKITRLQLSARDAWGLELGGRLWLDLGRDDLEDRVARFMKVYVPFTTLSPHVKRVDLRYPNGFAVDESAPSVPAVQ